MYSQHEQSETYWIPKAAVIILLVSNKYNIITSYNLFKIAAAVVIIIMKKGDQKVRNIQGSLYLLNFFNKYFQQYKT